MDRLIIKNQEFDSSMDARFLEIQNAVKLLVLNN